MKILHVNEKPPVIGYQTHAYPFSIIATSNDYLPWFYCNYIQLVCHLDFSNNRDIHLDFLTNYFFLNYPQGFPCLKSHFVKRRLISENYKGGVQQYIKDNLINNRYVLTWVDEYDLSSRRSYGKRHYFHDLLIYGYDESSFYTLGFDKDRLYKNVKIPFCELQSLEVTFPHWDIKIFIIEKDHDYVFEYDHMLTKQYLHEYANSLNSLHRFRGLANQNEPLAVGIETYDVILEYLKVLEKGETRLDVKPFHIIWEHKKFMTERIHFLLENHYINNYEMLDEFRNLENEALIMRNLMLKYDVSRRPEILKKISKIIAKIKSMEKPLLDKLLSLLN